MIKNLLFFSALILSASIVRAQPAGVVAHWDFATNGSVSPGTVIPDISGNGHDGIVYGDITADAGMMGVANTALFFHPDSTYGTYIDVPYASSLNLTSFTLSAIVKPVAFYTGNCQGNDIVCRGQDYTDGHYALVLCDNAYNDCSVADTNDYVFESTIGNTYYNDTDFRYTPTTVLNDWYTADLSFDGLFIKVYFNGVLKSTVMTNGTGIGTSNVGLRIGAGMTGSAFPYPFMGLIDDIVIFDRPLVDTEVLSWRTADPNTGVAKIAKQAEATIYPNPASDVIKLKLDANISRQTSYVIQNVAGQVVRRGELNNGELNVADMAPGVYYLQLWNKKTNYTGKFVKR